MQVRVQEQVRVQGLVHVHVGVQLQVRVQGQVKVQGQVHVEVRNQRLASDQSSWPGGGGPLCEPERQH